MSAIADMNRTTNELAEGWGAEFGHWDKQSWHDVVTGFSDANLYQTWSYDRARFRRRGVVHMVLRRGKAIVAAAQTRIIRVPGTRVGIAYVRWGPMWQRRDAAMDSEVFRQVVRALRTEFSRRRGLVVRLYPLAHAGSDTALAGILREEGYRPCGGRRTDRTLLLDLRPSLESLRAALDQKWRNCLNRAERNGLEVISGADERLFDEIAAMYTEMASRKSLGEPNDIGYLKLVQRDLPGELKLRVVVCRLDGLRCAGAIFSAIGATGLYIRGATSDAGLKTNGSYLVQWAFVRWLKEQGFMQFDLNGISPDVNPGTYHFKRGLAGKHGRDVEFLGRFQVADSALSEWVVKQGEWLSSCFRRLVHAKRASRATSSGNR